MTAHTFRRLRAILVLVTFVLALSAALAAGCSSIRSDPRWRTDTTPPHAPARGPASDRLAWKVRAKLPEPYAQACDLVSTPGGLLVAASVDALTLDGAALFRLAKGGPEKLLAWDGQGFLRARAFGSRVFVPDADAPFGLLSFAFSWDVDGYVFVSEPDGSFAVDAREVLPASYHVFDVARLAGGGTLVASTGAYREGATAYFADEAPAVLFADAGADRPWRRVLEYPSREAFGVSRFTWLHAAEDGSLLASIQSSRTDLPPAVRIAGLPDAPVVSEVEGLDGAPIRYASWRGRIYAVTARYGGSSLYSSDDGGRSFVRLGASRPQALAATEEAIYVLDGGTLARSMDGERWQRVSESIRMLEDAPTALVGPALVMHGGSLWAASPVTGEIFEAVPVP